MADNNNGRVANLPKAPHPALKALDRLVGTWRLEGGIHGIVTYEWMEGGFFFIQQFDLKQGDHTIKGVEYISFDEDTQTLRSHLMDTEGSNFTYTWKVEGDTITIHFGDKDSDNFFQGTLSQDGNTLRGKWQWPQPDGTLGGYETTEVRVT